MSTSPLEAFVWMFSTESREVNIDMQKTINNQ